MNKWPKSICTIIIHHNTYKLKYGSRWKQGVPSRPVCVVIHTDY